MNLDRSPSRFGQELRRWRATRGRSQLELAHLAGTTPRHVSFLETGRSRPSQELVLRLAVALEVPLRQRNVLLLSAGLPPAFPERGLDDAAMGPIRQVIDRLLDQHEPYPGVAFDRGYRILRKNAAATRLLAPAGDVDWLDAVFAPESPLRPTVENFAEIAFATLDLLRLEAFESGGDEVLRRMERHLRGVVRPASPAPDLPAPVVCPRFRFGDRVVRTLTTIARFGTARDVALDELRVELVFPADEDSARFFVELAG